MTEFQNKEAGVRSTTSDDPLLSYHLSQAINKLLTRPGQVSVTNIKRVAQVYGFDTFTEPLEKGNGDRLTVAGSILLIDIDFVRKYIEDTKDGEDVIMKDEDNNKSIVKNVSFSLSSNQKLNELLSQASLESQKSLKFVECLKKLYSFTNSDVSRPNSCNNVLLNNLKLQQKSQVIKEDQIEYDIIELNSFTENLKYLSLLDKLSIYSANHVSVINEAILNENDHEKSNNGNLVLFSYLNELCFILNSFLARETKLLIQKLLENSSANEDTFNGIFDILNGYTKFGKVETNLNNSQLGVFIKYWENNRLLRYKQIYKNDFDNDGDAEMINEKKIDSFIESFEKNSVNNQTNVKFVKLSVNHHFNNALLSLHDIILSEYFKTINEKSEASSINSNTKTATNINFLSKFKIPLTNISTFTNPKSRVCLNLQFSSPIWIPKDLVGKCFQSFATFEEADLDEISNEHTLDHQESESNFRTKKRNDINEIYIKNYNELFDKEELKNSNKNHKFNSKKPNLNEILKDFNEVNQKNYLLKLFSKNQENDNEKSKYPLDIKLSFKYNLVSHLHKIKSISLFNDRVHKSKDIDISGFKLPIKEQFLKYVNGDAKSNNISAIQEDHIEEVSPTGPLITSNNITFFSQKQNLQTTMSITSAMNNNSSQINEKNKFKIDMIESLEIMFENLRSFSIMWNLIDSLLNKTVILSKHNEDYIINKLYGGVSNHDKTKSTFTNFKEVIQDTTIEIIPNSHKPRRESRRASFISGDDRRTSVNIKENNRSQEGFTNNEDLNLDQFLKSINEGKSTMGSTIAKNVPEMKIKIKSLSSSCEISQSILSKNYIELIENKPRSDIYVLEVATNVKNFLLSKDFIIQNFKLFIYNGNIVDIEVFNGSIRFNTDTDDLQVKPKLEKILHFINLTEDLHSLLSIFFN